MSGELAEELTDIDVGMGIRDLKAQIYELNNTRIPNRQRLLLGERILGDNEQLASFVEPDQDEVDLMLICISMTSVMSASKDGILQLWELPEAEQGEQQEHHQHYPFCLRACYSNLSAIAVDWGTSRVLVAEENALALWFLSGVNNSNCNGFCGDVKLLWRSIGTGGHTKKIFALDADWPSNRALSGSKDKAIRLWDLCTGTSIFILEGHQHSVRCLSSSWHTEQVVSGSSDHSVRIWSLKSGQCTVLLQEAFRGIVTGVAACLERRVVLVAGGDALQLWHLPTEVELQRSHVGSTTTVGSSGSMFPPYCVHDDSLAWRFLGHRGAVTAISANFPMNQALSTSMDNTLRLWDLRKGCCMRCFTSREDVLYGFLSLAVDWARGHVAVGLSDRIVHVWDLETGEVIHTLGPHGEVVCAVAIS